MNLRRRVAGTGSWIFSNTNYKYWLENDNHPILWIHGGSGSGKTMLSTVLSKELLTSQHAPSSQECSVAYFFCDDKDDRLKTSYGLLTHVLAQLLKQNPNALTHFYNESALKIDKEKTVWTVEMLWRVLSRIVADEKLKPIYVIIDALGMLSSHRARF
jgi:predicted AAA+ superfamily ATPase